MSKNELWKDMLSLANKEGEFLLSYLANMNETLQNNAYRPS